MVIRLALLLFLVDCSCFAQQPLDSSPQVTFKDSVLLKGMRDYIKLMELRSGAAKDKTVLIVRDLQNGSTKNEYQWAIQATNRLDVVQKAIPAFMTQLDGYTVLIRYSANFTPLLDYSASYRANILEKMPISIRNQLLNNQPSDPFSTWVVHYEVGKQPSYDMALHDPALVK